MEEFQSYSLQHKIFYALWKIIPCTARLSLRPVFSLDQKQMESAPLRVSELKERLR